MDGFSGGQQIMSCMTGDIQTKHTLVDECGIIQRLIHSPDDQLSPAQRHYMCFSPRLPTVMVVKHWLGDYQQTNSIEALHTFY